MSAGCTPSAKCPAGLTSTSEPMRAVLRTAISIAIQPPIELPMMQARSSFSAARKSR